MVLRRLQREIAEELQGKLDFKHGKSAAKSDLLSSSSLRRRVINTNKNAFRADSDYTFWRASTCIDIISTSGAVRVKR